MLFKKVQARNTQGNLLPKDNAGIFVSQWNANLSEKIFVVPDIDDEGYHQEVKLVTTIIDVDFYEFNSGNTSEIETRFLSDITPSIEMRLKKKPQGMEAPPCRLRNTLFYTVIDSENKKRARQISENLFIQ